LRSALIFEGARSDAMTVSAFAGAEAASANNNTTTHRRPVPTMLELRYSQRR
jgi:hypothetical protein